MNDFNHGSKEAMLGRIYTSGRRVKRDDCYNKLKAAFYDGAELSEQDLAELVAYFEPTIPAKPKTAIQWVSKSMAKNDVRYYLNAARVTERGDLVAIDGHRIHFVASEGHEFDADKWLTRQGAACDVDGKFPDIYRFTDKAHNLPLTEWPNLCGEVKSVGKVKALQVGANWYNRQYLADALSGIESGTAHCEGKGAALHLVSSEGTRKAVIMPMRLD